MLQVRTLVRQEMASALERCDVLVCPVAPTPAYRLGEKVANPLTMYKGDLMTVNINLAGLPAVSLPCGLTTAAVGGGLSLPVGIQFIGRAFGEADLLRIAHIFEISGGGIGQQRPQVHASG
jgi:aspartyl-tRNA(Asn)/glutamyl-tRNA(Gln) amidotransferase subunit A